MNKLITTIGLLATFFVSSIYGFERIMSEEEALSKEEEVVYVIGEVHNNKRDIFQKTMLKQLAEEGKIILGLEGENRDWERPPTSTAFGLEEPFWLNGSVALSNLIDLFDYTAWKKFVSFENLSNEDDMYSKMISVEEQKHRMKLMLKNIQEYLKVAVLIKKDPKEVSFFSMQVSKNNRVLMNIANALYENEEAFDDYDGDFYKKHLGRNSIDDNFYNKLSRNSDEWFVLIKRMGQYFIKNISDKVMQKRLNSVLSKLSKFYKEIEEAKDVSEIPFERLRGIRIREIDPLILGLRNEVFLKNIQQAYNEKKHLKKPFFVIVGRGHVPFLRRELMARGFEVVVNEEVYDYSKLEL